MKLLNAAQIKDWDLFTIKHEPISSIQLMERAATACSSYLTNHVLTAFKGKRIHVVCGSGNNGGDGLAIARQLAMAGWEVVVWLIKGRAGTADFETNLKALPQHITVYEATPASGGLIKPDELVIDALLGSGIRGQVSGELAACIQYVNQCGAQIVSIDLPSGLPTEAEHAEQLQGAIIEANLTLTFQQPKCSFFFAECERYVGDIKVLDIGLHPGFLAAANSDTFWIGEALVKQILKPRSRFAHKGTQGKALMVAGSYGKFGAAVLAGKAALRGGCGLVTVYLPKTGFTILQTALPEALVETDDEVYELRNFPDTASYDAVGVGPGIGTHPYTQRALLKWLPSLHAPLVLDADGLNIFASAQVKPSLPSETILTPHPKEFDRIAGTSHDGFERLTKQRALAKELNAVIVLKGAYSSVAFPDGRLYFNSSGNPALATGGTGDVLTGLLTSLLAQGYSAQEAALAGVYLHGEAADLLVATERYTLLAGELADWIPKALYGKFN